MKKLLAASLVIITVLTSCNHNYDEEDDFITKPVTNNPKIVPSHGSSPFPISPSAPAS